MAAHSNPFHRIRAVARMPSPTAGPGTTVISALAVLASGVVVALFVVPPRLAAANAAERNHLTMTAGDGFIEYWRSGRRELPATLAESVAYWERFHAVKAVIAALLLIVSIALGILVLRRIARSPGRRAVPIAAHVAAGMVTAIPAAFALVVVVANVQGVVAPLASVLTLLPIGDDGPVGQTSAEVVRQLTDYSTSARIWPPLGVMVDDFARYHRVLAILAATVAVLCIAAALTTWRIIVAVEGRTRKVSAVLGGFALVAGLLGVAAAVVCIGNVTVAMQPAPALLDFFRGGW